MYLKYVRIAFPQKVEPHILARLMFLFVDTLVLNVCSKPKKILTRKGSMCDSTVLGIYLN